MCSETLLCLLASEAWHLHTFRPTYDQVRQGGGTREHSCFITWRVDPARCVFHDNDITNPTTIHQWSKILRRATGKKIKLTELHTPMWTVDVQNLTTSVQTVVRCRALWPQTRRSPRASVLIHTLRSPASPGFKRCLRGSIRARP